MKAIVGIACAAATLVAVLLVVVVVGIRPEPPAPELSMKAPSATVRRTIDVSVRRPGTYEHAREICLTRQDSSGWTEGRHQ